MASLHGLPFLALLFQMSRLLECVNLRVISLEACSPLHEGVQQQLSEQISLFSPGWPLADMPSCNACLPEVNPLHVSVARFVLDIAGLSQRAEVCDFASNALTSGLSQQLSGAFSRDSLAFQVWPGQVKA